MKWSFSAKQQQRRFLYTKLLFHCGLIKVYGASLEEKHKMEFASSVSSLIASHSSAFSMLLPYFRRPVFSETS